MPPVVNKLIDIAIVLALTAALVFVIIFASSMFVPRGPTWQGLNLWVSFIGRREIIGTMILTALVATAYGLWQQGRGGRRI